MVWLMLEDIGTFELKKSYLGFFGKENNVLEGILIYHVDDTDYGGTNKLTSKVIFKLK